MPAKRKSNGAPVRRASAAELKARKTRASKLETWQKSRDKVMSLVMAQKKAVVKAGGGKWNPEGSAARKREKAARQHRSRQQSAGSPRNKFEQSHHHMVLQVRCFTDSENEPIH